VRVILDSGETLDLGETEATPTIGIVDYSRRVTDDYGVTTVVERGFARRMSVRLVVPFDQTDALQRDLAAIRAKPARWIADEGVNWLDFRGFFKDFEIDLPVPPKAYCTLTVEALTATEAFADPGGDPAPLGQASTLQVLQPAAIGSAALVASSVPENDYPEWSAATTYPLGARVIKAATHRIYESGSIGNVGNDPAGISGKWTDVGPTNRWAMFDQALGSTTTAAGQITVSLSPGTVNAVALLDVKAAAVRVVTAGYDRTLVPNASGTVTFLDLPETAGQVTVTITGPGTVEVGTLMLGKLVGLGSTTEDAKAGITDFSRKEADEFGDIQVVERAWAKRATIPAKIRRDAIDLVAGRIAAVRAKPSLWIGKEGIETLTVYGFFKDFSIAVDTTICTLSLSIEGLSTAGKVEPIAASVDWSDVGDPAGTKPEDNATVGAPAGTEVAGKPAEEVVGQLEEQEAALDQLDLDVAQASISIAAAQATIAQMQTDAVATKAELEADIASLNATADQIQTDAAATRASLAAAQAEILAAGGRIDTIESTLGDQGASITSLSQTVSNHTGRLASIDTTLSANGASINQNAQAISAVQGDLASLSSTVSTQGASINQNAQAITTANQSIASLTTRVSSAESSISSQSSAITSLQGSVATLTTRINAANPNLLKNGGFENGMANWSVTNGGPFASQLSGSWGTVARTTSNVANGAYIVIVSDLVSVYQVTHTLSAESAFYINGGTGVGYTEIIWYASNGTTELRHDFGPQLTATYDFTLNGEGRRLLTWSIFPPAGAALARVVLTARKDSGTLTSLDWRQIKLEASTMATPYSSEAQIVQTASAVSTLNGSVATLSSTVSTQGASISSLQSASSTQAGQIASMQTTIGTQGSTITQQGSAISTLQGNYSSLSSTVTAQGATISSQATAISSLQGRASTLETRVSAGTSPNLISNGSFENGLAGWTDTSGWGAANANGWGYHAVTGANVADGSYTYITSSRAPIYPNSTYTASADLVQFISGGTGYQYVELLWYAGDGSYLSTAYGPTRVAGYDFDASGASRQTLKVTAQAPGNAAFANVRATFFKQNGVSQGFGVRQVKLERGAVASAYSTEASVAQAFSALSTLNTQYASLSSTVSTQGVTVSQNSTAITTLNSNVSSLMGRWGVEIDVNGYVSGVTTNNNGTRADFTIRADKFAIVSPGGGARTEYSNGNWRVYNAAGVLKVQLGVNI